MADLEPLQRAPADPALDAQAVFQRGVAEVRTLAHRTWTDHNTHDPGITILEVASYALTELAYRSSLPIEDLVAEPESPPVAADPDDAPEPPAQPGAFHQATQALPNAAWTERDWRKLLIDLPGVKNAWWVPHEGALLYADTIAKQLRTSDPGTPGVREVRLAGLYDVLIDFMDGVTTQAARDEVKARVRERVERWRNLCEDVVAIDAVPTQDYALCAEVELLTDADANAVAAQLLFDAERLLAPAVACRSLDEMLARGHAAHEIYNGPMLASGFIADADLDASVLPSEIRLSDLISVLMDVSGVRSVRAVTLSPVVRDGAGVEGPASVTNPWRVPVPPRALPRRSETFGRLVFTKRGVPVAGWNMTQMPAAVRARLEALREAARLALEAPRASDWPVPRGRQRALAEYRSFQLDFPAVYGIGAAGLPAGADDQRAAQALQLQAYLLLFDQLMADHLAALAEAPALLSVDAARLRALAQSLRDAPDDARTRAAQRVTSIAVHDKLYPAGLDATALARLSESAADAQRRHNRFLDHLLARVAEDFADYAAICASAFGHSDAMLAADKAIFLADTARLSRQRALAHQQHPADSARLWNTDNVSGFERRLCRLLGITDATRRNLATVSHDVYAEIDATPGDEFRFRVRDRNTGEILLSSSTHYATPEAAREQMMRAIERAQDPAAYQRGVASDGRHFFNIVDAAGEVIARRIHFYSDAQAMEDSIEHLRHYLLLHYSGEGLYVIEHILLRPREASDETLPICVDPACVDCSDDDPYSHRVHVVLPAYAGRFRDMAFRRFVEQTIRHELPAHLLPKVCWVSSDDMARLESAWHAWLDVHGGAASADRAGKLKTLIDVLYSVRNVYPSNALFDCAADEPKPYFMLGRTALGSVDAPPE